MMNKPQITKLEVTDIYMRNGVLTADLSDGSMFNLNVGGSYAQAVLDYIQKAIDTASIMAGVRNDD